MDTTLPVIEIQFDRSSGGDSDYDRKVADNMKVELLDSRDDSRVPLYESLDEDAQPIEQPFLPKQKSSLYLLVDPERTKYRARYSWGEHPDDYFVDEEFEIPNPPEAADVQR